MNDSELISNTPLDMTEWETIAVEGVFASIFGEPMQGEMTEEYIKKLGGMMQILTKEITRLRILVGEEVFCKDRRIN